MNQSEDTTKANNTTILEEIATQLEAARVKTDHCPSQKQGKEIDGTNTTYCPLAALNCTYKGSPRVFDNGDCQLENHNECHYTGQGDDLL